LAINKISQVKTKNEQSNALDLLSAYLVDGKLNSRQVMIIQHAIKHLGAVYTIVGHKISQNIVLVLF
jgi:hypothetical protein